MINLAYQGSNGATYLWALHHHKGQFGEKNLRIYNVLAKTIQMFGVLHMSATDFGLGI
jgi:hypothetical protein